MRVRCLSTAIVAAAASFAPASATDSNADGCQSVNGNWYCQSVSAISYDNFGLPGSFNKITSMANGVCASTPFEYSGGMAPLDGEISWHFRGPLRLKQFAYYTLESTNPAKRDIEKHVHQHAHKRKLQHINDKDRHHELVDRQLGPMVTATIDGQVVSWTNQYYSPSVPATGVAEGTTTCTADDMITATINGQVVSWKNPDGSTTTTAISTPSATPSDLATSTSGASPSATPSSASFVVSASSRHWARQAYYNANDQLAQNLVFLNNKGGQSSGVWDYIWGNSLSYASSDALTGSSSPQILADTLIPDNNEFSLFSSTPCTSSSCGTFRPGTVAYHGFSGTSKLFFLEFSMPLTGQTGFNADMPAAWVLNAEIPRTLQYGVKECSCFSTGCGEWDIFEVLESGSMKCKSTFHGARSGGDSDYFARPADGLIKLAVVFDEFTSSGHIIILDDNEIDFIQTVTHDQVTGLLAKVQQQGKLKAFALPEQSTLPI